MGQVVAFAQNLESFTCWGDKCGIQFAMPQKFAERCRIDGHAFRCPRGCLLSFGESELAKAKRELEAERKRKEWAEQDAKVAWEQTTKARKGAAIARGKLKAQSQRVKNGVCPCCKRHFTNLERHMHTKHPEFGKEAEETP